MKLFSFLYLKPILCKLDLKNDFFDISKFYLPMIIWTFFQTSEDIYRNKKCYLPNALRPTSFSYLDSYCGVSSRGYQGTYRFSEGTGTDVWPWFNVFVTPAILCELCLQRPQVFVECICYDRIVLWCFFTKHNHCLECTNFSRGI